MIVKPRAGSGSRGIRLLERRAELEALERDGTLLVQEHLPGPEYSLDVLARADGHVAARRPARAAEGGLGHRGHRPHAARRGARDASPARSPKLIGLTTVANVQVKGAADGEPALLEVNARFPGTMPLTIGAGVDMPRLAIGEALGHADPRRPAAVRGHRDGALLPGAVLRVRRHRRTCCATRRRSRRERARGHARALDVLRRPRPDRGQHRRVPRRSGWSRSAASTTCASTPTGCPSYVEAVQRRAPRPQVQLRCGIEAKLLDTRARSTCPAASTASTRSTPPTTRSPLADGPTHPREVRERIAGGDLDPAEVVDAILTATARALDRPQRVVIAHFLQHPPEDRADEADVPLEGLERLAAEAARTGQEIEISERWRCPSAATLRPFLRHGVPIALSTDSHKRETIGRYDYCLAVRARARKRAEMGVLDWILTAFVIAGALPLVAGCYQFALAGLHRFRLTARAGALEREPNVAVRGPRVERGGGDRAHDRHAARARLPGASDCASTSSTTRAPTRRPTSSRARRPSTRAACSTCAASGRRGQGAHAQPRAAHDPHGGLVRGGAGHRRRRDLHRPLAAPDGAPPRRSDGRRGDGYIKEGSRPGQLHEPLHRVRVHRRAGGRPPRAERARRAGVPGGRRAAAAAREPRGDRRRDRHVVAGRGHVHDLQRAARRRAGRCSSRTRSSGPRSRATSPGCGSSGCAGGAATSRSRCATGTLAAPRQRPARRHELRADLVLGLPDAGADGALVGRRWSRCSLLDRDLSLDVVPLAVGAQPRDVSVRDALGVRPGRPGGTARAGSRRSRSRA